MTQSEAPEGTVAIIGHPGNRRLIVKTKMGWWRHVDSGDVVDREDFSAGWDVVTQP